MIAFRSVIPVFECPAARSKACPPYRGREDLSHSAGRALALQRASAFRLKAVLQPMESRLQPARWTYRDGLTKSRLSPDESEPRRSFVQCASRVGTAEGSDFPPGGSQTVGVPLSGGAMGLRRTDSLRMTRSFKEQLHGPHRTLELHGAPRLSSRLSV